MDFKIQNTWGLRFSTASSLSKKQYENIALGLWKEGELNLSGKWKYGLSSSLNYRKLRLNHGKIHFDDEVLFGGKKLDSGVVVYFSEQRDFGMNSSASLHYRLTEKMTLGIFGSYFYSLGNSQGLYLEEKNEFWPWNKTKLFNRQSLDKPKARIVDNKFQFGVNLQFVF